MVPLGPSYVQQDPPLLLHRAEVKPVVFGPDRGEPVGDRDTDGTQTPSEHPAPFAIQPADALHAFAHARQPLARVQQ
ncbi:hypothetical protein DIPPA_31777 [Diplonema papillatum]|nr:hypothetical protein DIPPA_31777 [Diplonema papillatum]